MVLLTGCNGLIGASIARQLLKNGHQIRAIKRKNSDLSYLKDIEKNIEWVEADILDILSLEQAIDGTTTVVHVAAVVSFAPKDIQKMYKTNVEGTANVVNICLEKNVKKLLHVSSVAALGRPDLQKIDPDTVININENQKWEDSQLNSHYAKSKYKAELEVWRGVAEGLAAVVVNPSVVLGEGNWHQSSTQLFKYVHDKKKYYTEGFINYVDVQDVARAVVKLLESPIVNERFVISAGHTTYKALFESIATNFGIAAPSKPVTPFLANIVWRIEAIKSWFSGKAPLLTKETAQTARTKFIYDSQKIQKDIDFNFTDLNQTLARVCAYLQ
jgi:dihydroflavonol-4-reductase